MTDKRTLRRMIRWTHLPLAAASAFLLLEGCSQPQDVVESPAAEFAATLRTNPQLAAAAQRGVDHLMSLRSSLGLTADHGFQARSAVVDEQGSTHLRYDQTFRGVRVWEGESIVEISAEGSPRGVIHSLRAGINVPTAPSLTQGEALGIVHSDLNPRGPYASDPRVELVVFPVVEERERATRLRGVGGELNAEDLESVVTGYALAYHVHAALENGAPETSHTDYIIHAQTGAVLKKWSTLYTTASTGTGKSEYSGTVQLGTDSSGSAYQLHDTVRGMNITTYNLNHGTSGTGTVVSNSTNTFGDGNNYTAGGSTTSANGETAGVDAHYGTSMTNDYYKNVHGRNGIDGAGKATYNRVHYSSSYDNAYWDDTCFCMTYGDGSMFKVLTSLDVAGHEMTHGVTASTANLTYSGESGGLNESMSDIGGTMVEFYARDGKAGTTVPDTGGNFLIGDQLSATPLRYMYKPSKDGASKDAWSSTLKNLDVHYSSGPMNRAYYFLSQGASATTTSDYYTSYLPSGMTGIGNDKASRIAFRALTVKMTSSTNYAAARTAFLAAATDLYGATSAEYAAVENAFAGINVGSPHSGGGDTTPPTTSITSPTGGTVSGTITISATAMDNVGVTKVEFYAGTNLIGSDTSSPYTLSWNTTGVADGNYDLTTKAYDAAGNTGTSTKVTVVVKNGGTGDTTPPTTSLTAPTAGSTLSGTVTVSASAMDNVGVTKVEFYAGATLIGSSTTSPYSVSWNTTGVADGSYSLTSKAYDAAGNTGTSTAVSVTVKNGGGGTCGTTQQLLVNGGFESGATGWSASAGVIDGSNPTETHSGTYMGWLDGYGTKHTDNLYQQVAIPAAACTAKLSFWLAIQTAETDPVAYDKLTVTVQDAGGTVLGTLATYSNLDAGGYVQKTFDLSAYKGKTVRIAFKGVEDAYAATSFLIDDAALNITK